MELLLDELGVTREHPVVYVGRHARLTALFQELGDLLEDDYSPSQLLYASQLLSHLMGLMIRLRRASFREAPDATQRVQQSIAHMKEHLESPVEVTKLAGLANLSASHYSAVFRRLTGYSPKNYFTRLKIHRAAQLFRTTSESVKTISRRVGYEDPLYFSRAFRLVNGVCPSAYRQAGRTSLADHRSNRRGWATKRAP